MITFTYAKHSKGDLTVYGSFLQAQPSQKSNQMIRTGRPEKIKVYPPPHKDPTNFNTDQYFYLTLESTFGVIVSVKPVFAKSFK
jgi:hypothetical protein